MGDIIAGLLFAPILTLPGFYSRLCGLADA